MSPKSFRLSFVQLLLALLVACSPALPQQRPSPTPAQPAATADMPAAAPTAAIVVPTPTAKPVDPVQVVERSPRGVNFSERRPVIVITFDRLMNRASVAEHLGVSPAVDLDLSWEGEQLTIRTQQPLTPGTDYKFAIGQGARALDGNALAMEYRWRYRLARVLTGHTQPTKDMPDNHLSLEFGYAMNEDSVEEALTIAPVVAGRWNWNPESTEVRFEPESGFMGNTTYTLSLNGLLFEAGGESLPPEAESFKFKTPPPIRNVNPDEAGAREATFIQIDFDRPMDHATTEAAFAIEPATPGTFEWKELSLLFKPTAGYFEELTTYSVTVAASAADADGSPVMSDDYAWSFRTGAYQVEASFGLGPNAQVLDAAGRRAVQFLLNQHGPVPISFHLYRLDLEQFLNLYSSSFRGVQGYEKQELNTLGLPLAASWQFDNAAPSILNGYGLLVRETLLPPEVPAGAYVLNLSSRSVHDQLIVLVSERVVTVKQAEGQLVAWVSSPGGSPAQNVEVGVYARDGELLRQGATNHEGIFETQVDRDPQPLIVVAQAGDDFTAAGLSIEWESGGTLSRPWWLPTPAVLDYAAYIYTERPIYRPGQRVYYKAIVRRDDDAALSVIAAGTEVTVRIRDARNNVVQTRTLLSDEFGTVHGEFDLAEGAMLGDYAVEITIEGETHHQTFKVQDYRKPDFSVSVAANAEQFVAGDTMQVTVEAAYLFGEPVPDAKVIVNQYQLLPNRYCYEECTEEYIWVKAEIRPRSLRTNAEGSVNFDLTASLPEADPDLRWWSGQRHTTWGIEVTVDDGSHQVVTNFAAVDVYSAAEQLRLDTNGYFKTPGQAFPVLAEARTIYDEALPNHALVLELRQWDSYSGDFTNVVKSSEVMTGADGTVRFDLIVDKAGYYQLRLADRQGNSAEYKAWLYVFDDFGFADGQSDGGNLSLAAERDTYAPGETARLLVQSTFSGPALLTWERGTVRREQPVTLTAPLTRLDIPVLAEDAPNVFIGLAAWRQQDTSLAGSMTASLSDSRLHTAQLELLVPATDKLLTVTLAPDQEAYAPRDEATFTVRVTDAQGQPVAADISLALVDEAIFNLSEDLAGPIFDAFYFEREHIVRTYDALALQRTLWQGCECGGGGGGGYYEAGNPRSQFPDTAAWLPSVRTNAAGEAVVTLTLPDNLTSWRLTARANTASTQVGEALINFATRQPLVVRPLLPRTLTAGDRVEVSAMVQNYTGESQTVVVSIEAGNLLFTTPISQTLQLQPDEQRIVGWPVQAQQAGEVQVVVQAAAGEYSDAVQMPLQITPLAVRDVTTEVGQFSGDLHTTLALPEGALASSGARVELSRSIAGSLLTGIEYLTGFPYGCVEQTMSKALPNAVVGRAFHQLGIGSPALQADLPPKINASIQRLYGFQHDDGGWGWWYDDNTDAYQTAWVIFGLAVTAEAGYEVDSGVIRRGTEWLSQHLGSMDEPTRAFAVYSMAVAGYGDLKPTQTLAAKADKLDAFSQAALALALHELGAAEEARAMLARLEVSALTGDGLAHWSGANHDGHYSDKIMSSATRSTALALDAFVRIAPGHALEESIVQWLMSQRRHDGWGSTNETSFAILALTDHLLASEEAAGDTLYSVELNGQTLAEGTLGHGEPSATLEISASQMQSGDNNLVIWQSGAGRLYYVISQHVDLARTTIQPAGEVRVTRRYLDPRTNKPLIGAASVGQLVKVELTVNLPQEGFYVIVEDRLPGGLEALNEHLNITSHESQAYEEVRYYWREYGYNNKEVFGDRVSFFITELGKGRHVYTYFARATRTGSFVALPATAWGMYDLSLWGRSGSSQVRITD